MDMQQAEFSILPGNCRHQAKRYMQQKIAHLPAATGGHHGH